MPSSFFSIRKARSASVNWRYRFHCVAGSVSVRLVRGRQQPCDRAAQPFQLGGNLRCAGVWAWWRPRLAGGKDAESVTPPVCGLGGSHNRGASSNPRNGTCLARSGHSLRRPKKFGSASHAHVRRGGRTLPCVCGKSAKHVPKWDSRIAAATQKFVSQWKPWLERPIANRR